MSRVLTLSGSRPVTRQNRRYSARPFYLTILVFTSLAVFKWALDRGDEKLDCSSFPHDADDFICSDLFQCRLVRDAKDQCSFVRMNCPDHEDGFFSYLQFYYCTLADVKPLAFGILILWLSLLFSTIGIAASDFLCIDLSTLASFLGLSESLTGVTFLAFGNGSPDVFSTFAAMRSNSGSLAIGELLGAASFITSVVAGSMALVRPFKVARRSFVRDVGYFIVAVCFSMLLLADGRLHVWEAATMVGLYCFYVGLVVVWHWYIVRKRRVYERNLAARSHFHIPDNQELEIEEVEDDDPGVASESTSLLHGVDFDSLERADMPAWKDGDEDDETRNRYLAEIRDNMHVIRPSVRRRNTLNPIRPSLVGALEFQSVLSSLQRSRSTHQNVPINLPRYSDNRDYETQDSSHTCDNISVASHPRASRSSVDHLSPHGATGPGRIRAVSANDAAGLRLDTSVLDPSVTRPLVTVSRPMGDSSNTPLAHQADTNTELVVSTPRSGHSSPSLSPVVGTRPHTPSLLAPPDAFRSPNYQTEACHSQSPLPLSPRGTSLSPGGSDRGTPTSPFPALDIPGSASSRPPSLRLPAASSPTQLLQIHDSVFDDGCSRPRVQTKWWSAWAALPARTIVSTLFPTLDGWKAKSFWERLLGLAAAPSVLLLTITLPVVEPIQPQTQTGPVAVVVSPTDGESSTAPLVRLPDDSPLICAVDRGSSTNETTNQTNKTQPSHNRRRWDSELPAVQHQPDTSPVSTKEHCQWLVWIQLFSGPFFVTLISWTAVDPELKLRNLLLPFLCSLLFSLVCFTSLLLSTRRGNHSHTPNAWRPFLALLGFMVAIFWIATIATEVVSLLKTVGVILNISDSLLGLTVFAVGNSLGDLVADITVARLGYPVMALSACFGGPMLNILLGIGLGGLYMTLNANPESIVATGGSYEIAISKVLVISGATLLLTLVGLLIVIPLNNWRMDRKIGWGLVILWCISTLANVIAELVA
ncbi:hypothetical protein P170DRAFT_397544 [Aspergillus steynii IBT 23096]|uniref:Sodium/calcium exchanger membrane region domain-containing protein n=1 Tax=Aspergillus steynii IBT 23096 TaxID=1392250 RepID=A0A2I2GN37_9EURO|nr:uncharacterized protein P170DRAFT_397544 [Aspergillus steynii IBT 23096]PLB54283.1 hypothetical protein P170DRAFT_397544 [Aspergillus steynii IBT 23096]